MLTKRNNSPFTVELTLTNLIVEVFNVREYIMRFCKTFILLGMFVSAVANANNAVKLFSDVGHQQTHVTSSHKHIHENEQHLYAVKRAEFSLLRNLKKSDAILLNLPIGNTEGEVVNITIGANGTKHVVIRSYINKLPVSSIISLGKNSVYMELTTEYGIFSAAGNTDEVLIHQPSKLFSAKGITFENDAKIPQQLTAPSEPRTNTLKKTAKETSTFRKQEALHSQQRPTNGNKNLEVVSSPRLPDTQMATLNDYGDTAMFDLLIVYSSNVTDVVDDINAKIDHYIAYTNRAFEDSKIYAKVRLKGVMEVEYPYTNGDVALDDITFGKAPFEGVAEERVRVDADAVVLLTPDSENDTSAGIAWMNPHIKSNYFSSYSRMYSQTDVDFGASTFAHEIGHNLGLGHSRPQGATGADFDFGVGYRVPVPGAGFSTIMAYSTRDAYEVPFFSNPALLCGSLPCGLPKDDQDFGADAAYAINQVRKTVENYSSTATELIPIDEALDSISDANLRNCVNREVEEQTRYASEIYTLSCYQEVNSLEGVENFSSVSSFNFTNVTASDLTPLGSLKNLSWLTVSGTPATDFSVLQQLPQLESLSISGDFFDATQAEYLLSLTKLQRLRVNNDSLTQLPDLSPLEFLSDVTLITNVSDLSFLRRNNMLTSLSVYSNTGVTIPSGASWPALESLSLNNGTLEDLSLITQFKNLQSLELQNNAISTINGIAILENLESLRLNSNDITDISELSALTSLRELSLSYNPISDISALSGLTSLTNLNLRGIDTNNLETLSELTNLRSLYAGTYGYATDWSVISNMPKLTQLGLTDVNPSDLSFISDKSDQLTSLSLIEVNSSDLSFLFNHYKLTSLTVYPAFDTKLLCWQAKYLNSIQIGYVNVGGSNVESECDAADDTNDFDNDGVSNIDELANNTNPLEDNSAPSRVQFLVDRLDTFETSNRDDSRHTLVVKRSGDTSLETNVDLTIVEGSATPSRDFIVYDDSLSFEPGQNFSTFELNIIDDVRIEGEETFSLELANLTNAELGEISKIDATINDNKDGSDFQNDNSGSDTPSLSWETLYSSANEQDKTATVVLNRPTGLTGSFRVELSAIALSNNAEGEFELDTTALTFDAEEEFKTLTVSFNDDSENTGSRFISIRLINPVNTIIDPENASLTLEIKDDESTNAKIGFEQSYYRVAESVGLVQLKLVRDTEDTVDREFSILERDFGTATLGEDATLEGSPFVFPAGATEYFVNLTVIDDTTEEPLESLELELFGLPSDVKSESDFVSFYIDDNDGVNQPPTGTVSFSQANLVVNEADETVNITLVRESGSVGQRIVDVYATEGTASFDDFTFEEQTVTFEEGETQKTISLSILNDNAFEGAETFTLSLLSENEAAIGDIAELQIQISDDDEPPAPPGTVGFTRNTLDVDENAGAVQISLLRDGGSNGTLNITVSATNISTSSSDFTLIDDTIQFNDGEIEKVINVNIVNDTDDESTEQFSLAIYSANEGDIAGIDTITVNIADDDEPASTGGTSGGGSSGGSNASSGNSGGSSGIILLLLMPFVMARRIK